MDIYSQPPAFLVALMITRIVDGRCNSLENPGATIHPELILFGRGPANSRLFVLDGSVLQASALILSGGAWSAQLDAAPGCHSFSVCASSGEVSPTWEVTVDALARVCPPNLNSVRNVDPFKW